MTDTPPSPVEGDQPDREDPNPSTSGGATETTTPQEPTRREVLVPTRMFLVIGVAITVMAGIYIATAYEDAGSVMLVLAAALTFVCGGYLAFQLRGADGHDADAGPSELHGDQYLPHASIWPFWIGVATFLVANGLILGIWFLVPGAVLLVAALGGFIRQSRARA